MGNLFNDPNYEPVCIKTISTEEAVYSLKEAWFSVFNEYPSDKALFILVSQSALETGHWKQIRNYNFGNVKRIPGKPFTMFATGENLINPITKKLEYKWFNPPDPQTAFRAYPNAIDGAKDYILFLSDRKSSEDWRNKLYKKAFDLLKNGDAKGFSFTIHDAGYYSADPNIYTNTLVNLFNGYLKKKEALLTWTPPSNYGNVPAHSDIPDVEPPDTEVDNEPPTDPSPALFPASDPPEPVVTPSAKQSDSGFFALIMSILSIILNLFSRKK